MHICTRICPLYRAIALLTLLFVATAAHAQSLSSPASVSALIYSSSTTELFWKPQAGSMVEITRNGVLLGRFDTRSLYQPELQKGKQYNYTLRSVDSSDRRSQAVNIVINTANFTSPDRRIYPTIGNGQGQAESIPTPSQNAAQAGANTTGESALSAPDAISAFIYSKSSAELFWTPQANTLVEVSRNGEILGRFGTRSMYQPGLQRGKPYHYTLRSVERNGRRSAPINLLINTANFTRDQV